MEESKINTRELVDWSIKKLEEGTKSVKVMLIGGTCGMLATIVTLCFCVVSRFVPVFLWLAVGMSAIMSLVFIVGFIAEIDMFRRKNKDLKQWKALRDIYDFVDLYQKNH